MNNKVEKGWMGVPFVVMTNAANVVMSRTFLGEGGWIYTLQLGFPMFPKQRKEEGMSMYVSWEKADYPNKMEDHYVVSTPPHFHTREVVLAVWSRGVALVEALDGQGRRNEPFDPEALLLSLEEGTQGAWEEAIGVLGNDLDPVTIFADFYLNRTKALDETGFWKTGRPFSAAH